MEPLVLTPGEIIAQLSERGHVEWELAMARAEVVRLRARIDELEGADQP